MMTRLLLFLRTVMLGACLLAADLRAAETNVFNVATEFERANKFYEQGKFAEATTAYENIVRAGVSAPGVWFNLGNASYKSGQVGRAIASYRMAERVTPRDAALRANLQFIRGKVYSDERTRVPAWKSALRLFTLNEWTVAAAVALWAFFAVLAVATLTRIRYPKTATALFLITLVGGTGLLLAWSDQAGGREAVVVAREVTARFGPLDESQTAFQLRDGAECAVLESKGDWLQVRDAEQRTGWIRRDDAIVLPGPVAVSRSTAGR